MKWQVLGFSFAVMFLVAQVGCNKAAQDPAGGGEAHGHEEGHDHDHGDAPHGGQLLELGDEEYHAEITHDDDTHQVTVYLLDSEVNDAVLAGEDAVKINVVVDGTPGSYSLKAVDPVDGQASQFQLVSEALARALDSEEETVKRKLAVTINGESYGANIGAHEHDHEGHGHDEDGHDDHDDDHDGHDDHDDH